MSLCRFHAARKARPRSHAGNNYNRAEEVTAPPFAERRETPRRRDAALAWPLLNEAAAAVARMSSLQPSRRPST
jgi:hypothetical protein